MTKFDYPVTVEAPERNITKLKASVELPDGRYHLWFDAHTMQLKADVLFKRPPTGIKLRDKGYFDCRRLNPHSVRNTKLIAAMIQQITENGTVKRMIDEIAAEHIDKHRSGSIKIAVRRYWAEQMRNCTAGSSNPLVADLSLDEFIFASAELADKLSA